MGPNSLSTVANREWNRSNNWKSLYPVYHYNFMLCIVSTCNKGGAVLLYANKKSWLCIDANILLAI
ncbi:hypothetical protein BU23DRAFT_138385 [Bimuria novae-zelandiae CBS 107.79]|uniref:Uncharacterized protein n=1 Tax=Bimuria novae-zelandiae CBS 107.79 TaxID=1447943 RepID=A0A6A5VJ73_9PLEO|nr:hypothetical protein BU23DRAFT_138385 [Bimuria novae-zelandiae CBS 107.79]